MTHGTRRVLLVLIELCGHVRLLIFWSIYKTKYDFSDKFHIYEIEL